MQGQKHVVDKVKIPWQLKTKNTYIAIKLKGANKINARPCVKHIQ
jgi:hypothetical protein